MAMPSTAQRVLLYSGGALIVVLAVVFADSPLLRSLTRGPRTEAQRESAAAREQAKRGADLCILVIGNSHVSAADPIRRLVECFEHDGRRTRVFWDVASMGNAHFEDHLRSERTLKLIDEGDWDFIVLQGQQYSTSGRFSYPIDAALELGERVKDAGAKAILLPEWKQVGNDDEAVRVQALHETIAPKIDAIIAPVGLAWDRALTTDPSLPLHSGDGNHAAPLGGYLTGLVLYACISQRDPRGLPPPARLAVDDPTRAMLQEVAWESAAALRSPPNNED